MSDRKAYIHNETPNVCLKGDVRVGEGFKLGRGIIPRIYIAEPMNPRCSISRDTGKGLLVQYLLEHIGESVDRETLAHISHLRLSTVKDYMTEIGHAFSNSLFFELQHPYRTATYVLVEREKQKHQFSSEQSREESNVSHTYLFEI